ncbi:MAG TPA: LysE family translocator [Pedobacter sp.]|jgi:RhtB (resistance to homoserine/threonine) family protein
MQGIHHFETFLITGILLNLTPGNDTIFILSKSIAQGKKAGIISVLGIATGSVIHTVLAAYGLSVIITKSLLIFNLIKYAGAAYLFYLGYKMFKDKSELNTRIIQRHKAINYIKIYGDAILTNVLNPKVALFFIAFLPQFINPDATNTMLPFMVLGATFILTGTTWCLILAVFASTIFAKFKSNTNIAVYFNKVCGLSLIALGIKVAFTGRK